MGFAGAFRRSELVAIDRENVQIDEIGAIVLLCRGKTDQVGHGRTVSIPRVRGRLCPVAALEGWLRVSGISAGPLFRPIAKGGEAAERRISAEAVARILKKRTQAIGCDPKSYSGHSLRAGFATEAARLGVPKWRIKAQTGSSQHRPTPSVTLPRVPVASSVMPISMCSIGSKSTSTG
jgi:integrase